MRSVNDGSPLYVHKDESGFLILDAENLPLASSEDYTSADRSVGSIFEALNPGDNIKLADGYFVLDDSLDLVQDWQII
jgi:hypothetical protein